MAVVDVLKYPDPGLNLSSAPVHNFDAKLAQVVNDLIDTMHHAKSIGLSAPQIGVRRQVLVMDCSQDQSDPEVYINPAILGRKGFCLIEERCVSVPGEKAMVIRSAEVSIRAFNVQGLSFERDISGMKAVCLQHEMDHFDGVLLADRMNWFRRRRLKARLKSPVEAA